jgi:hypothetical protein
MVCGWPDSHAVSRQQCRFKQRHLKQPLRCSAGTWVGLVEGVEQSCRCHMCVDLCRDNALVAEQFLNTADIGAVVEKVRGKTVSESVWAGPAGEPCGSQMLLKQTGDPTH